MPAFAPLRLSLLKKATLGAVALLASVLLFAWLALPPLIQSQAERIVREKTGHRLVLDQPAFNPFTLSLRLAHLALSEPDGKPLLAFDSLLVDFSAASLTSRAWVFDAIRLERPAATLVEFADGRLNWSAFLDGLRDPAAAPATGGLPRLEIRSLALAAGRLDFADRRGTPGFAARVEPIDLELNDISTFPDENGRFRLAARTAGGAVLELAGEVKLNPLAVGGSLKLAGLQLAQFAPYLDFLPAPPAGELTLAAAYRAGNSGAQLEATVDQIEARLTGLRLPLGKAGAAQLAVDEIGLGQGRFDLGRRSLELGKLEAVGVRLTLPQHQHAPELGRLGLEQVRVDLSERRAAVGRISLNGGGVRMTRMADGRIDLLEALAGLRSVPSAPPAATSAPSPAPWRYQIDQLAVAGLGLELRDATVAPAAVLTLERIALEAAGVSEDFARPVPLKLAFDVRQGGRFEAQGQIVPGGPSVALKLKLADLALQPAQPYLAARALLTLTSGRFATEATLRYDEKGLDYRGEFAVRELRLAEIETGATFLAWKSLGSRDLHLTRERLAFGELRLNGLDTQLIIDKDKNVNLKKILRPLPDAPAEAAAEKSGRPFVVNVERLRFYNGEMDFADHSLLLPFGTRIHALRGSLSHLSSEPGAPGQLELEGEVDDYGMARAVGQVDLFKPTEFMDLRVIFRNVEMTRLTPYTATFAGRKINSGKLSLDLQYKIKQRRLQGENQVVMDRLVLGERVESPTAKDLPLDLAIAILQDSDGRIDLGLPVSGDLDDPEFSYGQIVWKAIANVLGKIASAPFRALAALFGGGGEPLEGVGFEPGASVLTPPEREKVVRIAAALAQRPALTVGIGGRYADADRVALQDLQLRRAIVAQMGQRVSEQWDPGALSTHQPKVRDALEALYREQVGAGDLAALKEGYRRANPGRLEETVAGKMMSRLSGLLHGKKTLSAEEQAQLAGATDFHAVLFERLRARMVVTDAALQTLARTRGGAVIAALRAAGVDAARVRELPPEQAASAAAEIPVQLALETAAK